MGAAIGAAAAIVALSSGVSALIFGLWPGLKPEPPPERLAASITKLAVEPGVRLRDYLTRMGVLDDYVGLSNESERIRSLVLESAGALTRGAEGPEVAALQRLLIDHGVYDGAVDGKFSQAMENAVKMFQRREGEAADGVFGPATLLKLVGPGPASLERQGLLVYVEVKVEGFRVREFAPLRASLYRADDGVRAKGPGVMPIEDLLGPALPPDVAKTLNRLGEATRSSIRPRAPNDQRGKVIWLATPPSRGSYFVRIELYDNAGELVNFTDSPTFRLKGSR
jgi:peptidoglycan hydrolase-like protein with peptidoglycan-binding domain